MTNRKLSTRRRARAGTRSEINITPLVDIALVLLIIYMVSPPLPMHAWPIAIPDARRGARAAPTASHLSLIYHETGELRLDGQAVSIEELPKLLAARLPAVADGVVFLDAADFLEYERVMVVMGIIRAAGGELALVTDPS